jgi:hypothetical protein
MLITHFKVYTCHAPAHSGARSGVRVDEENLVWWPRMNDRPATPWRRSDGDALNW